MGKKRKRADEREKLPLNAPEIKKKLLKEIIEPVAAAVAAGVVPVVDEASPERPRKKASRF